MFKVTVNKIWSESSKFRFFFVPLLEKAVKFDLAKKSQNLKK